MKSATGFLVIFQILSCCFARPQSFRSIYDDSSPAFQGSFNLGSQVQSVQQLPTYSSGWDGYHPTFSAYSLGTMVDGLLGAASNIIGGLFGNYYPPPSPYQGRGARAR